MKYLVFSSMLVLSVFKCTGASALDAKQIYKLIAGADKVTPPPPLDLKEGLRLCADIVADLRKAAWDDADAFDFDRLKDEGTVKYMCLEAENDNEHPVAKLCIEALAKECEGIKAPTIKADSSN